MASTKEQCHDRECYGSSQSDMTVEEMMRMDNVK